MTAAGSIVLDRDDFGYVLFKLNGQSNEDYSWHTVVLALKRDDAIKFAEGIRKCASGEEPHYKWDPPKQRQTGGLEK